MKLEGVCNTCHRTFLLAEILPPPEGTGGRCPSCGTHFGRHYVSTLPALLREAEADADAIASSFNRLKDLHPGFTVSGADFLRRLAAELETSDRRDVSA